MLDNPTEERAEGPTPNGGDYSIIYYQDADGQPIAKDEFVKAEVIEFTAQGKQVFRTYLNKVTSQT